MHKLKILAGRLRAWRKRRQLERYLDKIEHERMQATFDLMFQTGKPVLGIVDEKGNFRLKVIDEED